MPNGHSHTSATILISGALCIGAAVLVYETQRVEWLALPVGALAGLLLSPDLDIERGSISNHHARRVSWLFGWLWRWYWWPYGKLMVHRGASHWMIAGTLVRLVYAFWWLPLVWLPPLAWAGTFAAGLATADAVHIGMDLL